jgi:putative addiction module component (TIGR02574 family)
MEQSKKIFDEIESLPIDIRVKLVDRLLESISPSTTEIKMAWQDEVEKRVADIRTGKVKTIDGEEVFSGLKARLSK